MPATPVRRGEDERADPVRVPEGEFLRDHAAEGLAVDVRTLDAEDVEHREGVVHERHDVDRPVRHRRAPVATQVVRDDPEGLGQVRDVPAPARDVSAEPFEEHEGDGVVRPVEFDVEAGAVRALQG